MLVSARGAKGSSKVTIVARLTMIGTLGRVHEREVFWKRSPQGLVEDDVCILRDKAATHKLAEPFALREL